MSMVVRAETAPLKLPEAPRTTTCDGLTHLDAEVTLDDAQAFRES